MSRYKAYPEYKDSGVEWLGLVPKNWKICRIKNISTVNPAKSEARALAPETEVSFIPMEAIGENGELDASRTKSISEVISGYSYVADGDIMIAKITPCFENGKGAVVQNLVNGIGFATTEVINVRPNSPEDSAFLFYLLSAAPFRRLAEGSMYGAGGQKRVADSFVAEYHLSLPGCSERTKIAAFLDHETARIDVLIEKQQRLIELLKEKRQAAISYAVTKGLNPSAPMKDSGVEWLGEVPAHWGITQIKFEAELNPKKAVVDLTPALECSFVPMEKLKTDFLLLDEIRSVADVYAGYTCFCNDDVLMAKVTPCFENKNIAVAQGLMNGVGFGSTEIYVLRAGNNLKNYFLLYRLQENEFMNIATATMTGAGGLKRVPTEIVNNFRFALPPLKEQLDICAYLEMQKDKFGALETFAKYQVELLKERRTALISAAVTGKIDVRDWQAAA